MLQEMTDKGLIIFYKKLCRTYVNCSDFVRGKNETVIPQVYRELKKRGLEVCMKE